MKKRALCLLLIAVLLLPLLIACAGKSGDENPADSNYNSANGTQEQTPESSEKEEPETNGNLEVRGLTRERFEYIDLGKVRFIGLDEIRTGKGTAELLVDGGEFLSVMDSLAQEYSATEITDNCVMIHHSGTDHAETHIIIGRFFKADTPVPAGYDYFDLLTEKAAYAVYSSEKFSGDLVNGPEDAYSLTRDQILSDNVSIPFPQAYWHAVVFTNGIPVQGQYRYGYLFSIGEPSTK